MNGKPGMSAVLGSGLPGHLQSTRKPTTLTTNLYAEYSSDFSCGVHTLSLNLLDGLIRIHGQRYFNEPLLR